MVFFQSETCCNSIALRFGLESKTHQASGRIAREGQGLSRLGRHSPPEALCRPFSPWEESRPYTERTALCCYRPSFIPHKKATRP